MLVFLFRWIVVVNRRIGLRVLIGCLGGVDFLVSFRWSFVFFKFIVGDSDLINCVIYWILNKS